MREIGGSAEKQSGGTCAQAGWTIEKQSGGTCAQAGWTTGKQSGGTCAQAGWTTRKRGGRASGQTGWKIRGRVVKYSKEERLEIGRRIYEKEINKAEAALEYDIDMYTARDYMRLYKASQKLAMAAQTPPCGKTGEPGAEPDRAERISERKPAGAGVTEDEPAFAEGNGDGPAFAEEEKVKAYEKMTKTELIRELEKLKKENACS